MRRRGRFLGVVGGLVALAVVAACGGGDGGGQSDNSAEEAAAGALAAARQAVTAAVENPTGILLDKPLSSRPPTGKLVVVPSSPTPVVKIRDAAMIEAAEALGWRVEFIPVGTGPEDAAKAFDAALNLQPDAVMFSGTPVALLESQLDRARDMGVPVLAESITDPVQDGIISTSLDSVPQVTQYGTLIGQYVASTSDGDAHVAVFTISAYPILTVFTDSFKRSLTAACPTCKVVVVNQQISDLGTNTPVSVVDTLQRDPNINWAIFSIGDLTLGVHEALAAAGLSDRVRIGGETPSQANVEALRLGTEEVWAGFAATVLGWRDIDMLARYFVNDPLDVANETLLPTQLLTNENVGSAVLDESGYWVGFPGYAEAFARLWQLG